MNPETGKHVRSNKKFFVYKLILVLCISAVWIYTIDQPAIVSISYILIILILVRGADFLINKLLEYMGYR